MNKHELANPVWTLYKVYKEFVNSCVYISPVWLSANKTMNLDRLSKSMISMISNGGHACLETDADSHYIIIILRTIIP